MRLRDFLYQGGTILKVWHALGGGPRRRGRSKAFWRGGDGFNVAIDASKNTWYDFARGEGGGILGLIQRVLDCDRRAASAWLAQSFSLERGGLKSDLSPRAHPSAQGSSGVDSSGKLPVRVATPTARRPETGSGRGR
jgi:hypothetical protein